MRINHYYKRLSILITCGWLGLFSILPILLVFIISLLQHSDSQLIIWHFTLANYQQLFNQLFFKILMHSLMFALITTLITLFIAYPSAFFIARSQPKYQMILLLLLMIPFWTSSLIRTYALLAIIKVHGLLNSVLLFLGIIHQPLQILYTNTAVMLGIVYNLLPFMIIPIYSNIARLDAKLFEAARDLGASRLTIFFHIVLPLSMPGIIAGILFVFLPGMTLFYIPDLLGGAKSLLLGNLIQNQFLGIANWPSGSATSIFLMGLMLVLLWVYRYFRNVHEITWTI